MTLLSKVALLCSHVLSAVSLEATNNCYAGDCAGLIKTLDKSPIQKAGIEYLFNLLAIPIEKLMHKPSFSEMGKSDMFSMVRTLLVILLGLLEQKWT